jgi:putative flippase GtrA
VVQTRGSEPTEPTEPRETVRTRPALLVRLFRYTTGSVVALVVSEIVLLTAYGVAGLPTVIATVLAFLAGAVPNWVLNRRWAWARSDRANLRREVLPYATIVVASLVLATGFTAAADRLARVLTDSVALRSAFVGAAYLLTSFVMFVGKFVLFDRVVFVDDTGSA